MSKLTTEDVAPIAQKIQEAEISVRQALRLAAQIDLAWYDYERIIRLGTELNTLADGLLRLSERRLESSYHEEIAEMEKCVAPLNLVSRKGILL